MGHEYYDQDEPLQCISEIEDVVNINEILLCQQPAYDKIINTEVLLKNRDDVQTIKVFQQSIGPDGYITGKYDDKTLL